MLTPPVKISSNRKRKKTSQAHHTLETFLAYRLGQVQDQEVDHEDYGQNPHHWGYFLGPLG